MFRNSEAIFLFAGAGILLFLSTQRNKQKTKKSNENTRSENSNDTTGASIVTDENLEDLDSVDRIIHSESKDSIITRPIDRYREILKRNLDPYGRAQLGMLYQIRAGDTPLSVCREALGGTRDRADPRMREFEIELLIRMCCGPWNQANYAVNIDELKDYPMEMIDTVSMGISFEPVYQDNRKRIEEGLRPTAGAGFRFALVWIPMIDTDLLENEGIVSTRGMYHPDTEKNIGGSMIDPPQEILDIGFEYVTNNRVGCNLPEGDFRKEIVAE